MAAATVEIGSDGRIAAARVALGSCSPVAVRLRELEAALAGKPADGRLLEAFEDNHFARLSPIDDVRGTSDYRIAAAREIAGRALLIAVGAGGAEAVAA
jgi:CO/xanthine dehydrogenase FAD-binding subunit